MDLRVSAAPDRPIAPVSPEFSGRRKNLERLELEAQLTHQRVMTQAVLEQRERSPVVLVLVGVEPSCASDRGRATSSAISRCGSSSSATSRSGCARAGGRAAFDPARHPIYVWEDELGEQVYGFPALARRDGVKAAFFLAGRPPTAMHGTATCGRGKVEALTAFLAQRIPALSGSAVDARACMYTTTPDEQILVGLHPAHPRVAIAAGFSGHGFKFVPLIGEIMADLAERGRTDRPIDLFDVTRSPGPTRPGRADPSAHRRPAVRARSTKTAGAVESQ